MLQTIMKSEVIGYILLALGGIGLIMEVILGLKYRHFLKKTWKIGVEKHELTENIKKKYELCHRMGMNVNNVDKFVDKYVYRQKMMGIMLCTWEDLCGQLCSIVGGVAVLSVILSILGGCGQNVINQYIIQGSICMTMLITFWRMGNISKKKEVIHLNLCDYLENIYQVRLEKEKENPEWSRQYRKEMDKLEQKTRQEKHKKSKKNDKRSELERMKAELVEELKQERMENEKRRLEEKQNAEKEQQILKEKAIKENEEKVKEQEKEQVAKTSKTEEVKVKEKEEKPTTVETEPEEERILQDILKEYLGSVE